MKRNNTYEQDISINRVSPLLGSPEMDYGQDGSKTRSGGYVAWPENRINRSIISEEDNRPMIRKGYVAWPEAV